MGIFHAGIFRSGVALDSIARETYLFEFSEEFYRTRSAPWAFYGGSILARFQNRDSLSSGRRSIDPCTVEVLLWEFPAPPF